MFASKMFLSRPSRLRRLGTVGLLGVMTVIAAFNGIAWMQARAMTHYVPGAVIRTRKPELLSNREKAWIVLTGVRVPRPINTKTPETVGLSYETHTIELPDGEYLEAWFSPAENAGKSHDSVLAEDIVAQGTVLLFPPYGGSKEALLAPGKIFHELGYDVLWVDFRGAGGSSGSETTLGVREGEDVAHAVRYIEQIGTDQPIILFGGSMGAVAVMRAISHENVTPDAVIIESPFDRMLNAVRHRFKASGLPSFPSAETLLFWGGLQQGIDAFSHNPTDYAQSMDMPVLLMHGEADTRITNEDAKAVFDQLPGQKELVIFPTVGHGAFAGDDPEGWKQQVQAFLADAI